MRYLSKSFSASLLSAGIIACILFFTGCFHNQPGKNEIELKKWISWEVTLKKDITPLETANTLAAIDKYILDHLAAQGFYIVKITFYHKDILVHGNPAILVQADIIVRPAVQAPPTIPPKKPQPKYELPKISSNITDINNAE